MRACVYVYVYVYVYVCVCVSEWVFVCARTCMSSCIPFSYAAAVKIDRHGLGFDPIAAMPRDVQRMKLQYAWRRSRSSVGWSVLVMVMVMVMVVVSVG